MMFDFTIKDVARATIKQCELFNCDIDTCWKKYMHPLILEKFALEEVKIYINKSRYREL